MIIRSACIVSFLAWVELVECTSVSICRTRGRTRSSMCYSGCNQHIDCLLWLNRHCSSVRRRGGFACQVSCLGMIFTSEVSLDCGRRGAGMEVRVPCIACRISLAPPNHVFFKTKHETTKKLKQKKHAVAKDAYRMPRLCARPSAAPQQPPFRAAYHPVFLS